MQWPVPVLVRGVCPPASMQVLTNTQDLTLSAGNELQILFVAKDKQGIRKSVGGDLFNVVWRSASDKTAPASVARVTDLGTGEYHAIFNDTAAGAYSLSALYEDRHIAGSPLTVKVRPGELEPVKTTATGTALTECVARRESTIQVQQLALLFGRALCGCGVELRGPCGHSACAADPRADYAVHRCDIVAGGLCDTC